MRGSIRLGTLAGIGVFVHWTFWLLIGWVLFGGLATGQGIVPALASAGFVLALFGCVVLHELGHALAARRYGIPTRDITLLPIGGVARLERMPERPSQELFVALAGPLVNVVIAGTIFVALSASGNAIAAFDLAAGGNFFANLMWVNVGLVVFNMIPAFPMDGGRVLRALLGLFTSYESATRVAALVGQSLAVVFAVLGLFVVGNPFLILIAAFVFLGAGAEARSVAMRSKVAGYKVRDAMVTRFQALPGYLSLDTASLDVLASPQRDFPVVHEEQLVGMLRRRDLLAALEDGRGQAPLVETMRTDFAQVTVDTPLSDALRISGETGDEIMPVVENGHLAGILDTTTAAEVVLTRARLARAGRWMLGQPLSSDVARHHD